MKITAETLVQNFFRSFTEPFSLDNFYGLLSKCGVKATKEECEGYLAGNPYVFTLANGMYATKACMFTKQYFSIKPERKELDKGVFIAGHRCMPFVDSDILSCSITFVYKKHPLPVKIVEMDSSFIMELYTLFGDEYSPQYIAQDPANAGMDLSAMDYTLPPTVKITGVSTDALVKDGFKAGDRLLCRVVDWDNCIVEVEFTPREENEACLPDSQGNPQSRHLQMTNEDIEREHWYSLLEKYLLESFSVVGPGDSIEEQLSMVFAENRSKLCVKNCGSIEEFFLRTKKIGFELFGVETRLWFKGQDVPAIGSWNEVDYQIPEEQKNIRPVAEKFEEVPQYIVDAAIKDQLYSKICDMEVILKKLYPNSYRISSVQQKMMLLHLKNRHDILSAKYNRFADSEISGVRHRILELFGQVNALVYAIDLAGLELSVFPQQSIVVLSQIYGHINHILEATESDPASVLRDINEISISVDGMQMNFECVEEELNEVLARESKNGFVVLK